MLIRPYLNDILNAGILSDESIKKDERRAKWYCPPRHAQRQLALEFGYFRVATTKEGERPMMDDAPRDSTVFRAPICFRVP
jgi:hypothetical protein